MNEKTFPKLYGNSANGKVKEWCIKVSIINKIVTTEILNGYIDGKKALSKRETLSGKNIGKKNETTAWQQAVNEAEKKWKNKKEKEGYTEDIKVNKHKPFYPMLAKTFSINNYDKNRKTIQFPCKIQPKLDGIRCYAYKNDDGNICLKSRVGKEFLHLKHIKDSLKELFDENKIDTYYLDGELYTNEYPFEEITGLCRKEKLSEKDISKMNMINFELFDIYDKNNTSMCFTNRSFILKNLIGNHKKSNLKYVLTEDCNNIEDIEKFHHKYIKDGYEGIILRNSNSPYRVKTRTTDLQKYKEFIDSEYPIIGFSEASGEDKGTIVWECEYKNHKGECKKFSVRPQGTREKRSQYFKECNEDFSKYKYKLLTVRYQELSQEGCPRFPVGIDLRFDL